MSSIKLESNASGTGIFTLASPATNTNRTLTLPDATGTVQVSGAAISGTTGSFSGDLSFNSGYGSTAVAYGCRAWVNFNQTGTQAIRASGNVSSIGDDGVGRTTVNFTNAMPDANYAQVFGTGDYAVEFCDRLALGQSSNSSKTTALTRIDLADTSGNRDYAEVNIVIFR